MLEMLLVRHGQTDWNVSRMVMGRRPIPLNATGERQADGVSRYLENAGLRAIISSPVMRAMQTAEAIASRQYGAVVEAHDGLAEIDYGDWVGKSFEQVKMEYGEIWKMYHADPTDVELPGGERMSDVAKRVSVLISEVRKKYDDGRVVLVSHADVIKVALLDVLGLEMKRIANYSVDNCALILIRIDGNSSPKMIAYNHMNGFGNDM